MPTIPQLVAAAEEGDRPAARELFTRLYAELHILAQSQLRRVGPSLSLGTTTLLHEAYIKLAGPHEARFPDHGRFLAYASKALRGVVIDYARSRRVQRRGGGFEFTMLDGNEPASPSPGLFGESLEELGAGLEELERLDPRLAQLVDLYFFAGFSFKEIAETMCVSERTVSRDWRKARMLLRRILSGEAQ